MRQQKILTDTMSIYFPQKAQRKRPVERLKKLSRKRDRSVNYLTIDAIMQYLEREEA